MGIHVSGISISLSLLMLLGWSLMRLASLTLRVYQQWGSRSINLTPFQIGYSSLSRGRVQKRRRSLSCRVLWSSPSWKPYSKLLGLMRQTLQACKQGFACYRLDNGPYQVFTRSSNQYKRNRLRALKFVSRVQVKSKWSVRKLVNSRAIKYLSWAMESFRFIK